MIIKEEALVGNEHGCAARAMIPAQLNTLLGGCALLLTKRRSKLKLWRRGGQFWRTHYVTFLCVCNVNQTVEQKRHLEAAQEVFLPEQTCYIHTVHGENVYVQ